MGAYAPAPIGSSTVMEDAMEKVMKPLIAAMAKEGKPLLRCALCRADGN